MRRIGVSALKILAFLGIWTALTASVVLATITFGGEGVFAVREAALATEIALCVAVVIALIVMARLVDKRAWETLGFPAARLIDLMTGTFLGAAIFALPLGLLVLMGAARYEPDLAMFSTDALALALVACFFNVVTQEVLVRSYVFQELWAKYGAPIATGVTTALFVALHAVPISQGTQGLIAGANILIASLMLSLAYVRTGALWLAIGLHLGWNALQGPVLGINVTGADLGFGHWSLFTFPGDALFTGGSMGVEGGLVGLIGPAVGLAIVAFAFKQQPKPNFQSETK